MGQGHSTVGCWSVAKLLPSYFEILGRCYLFLLSLSSFGFCCFVCLLFSVLFFSLKQQQQEKKIPRVPKHHGDHSPYARETALGQSHDEAVVLGLRTAGNLRSASRLPFPLCPNDAVRAQGTRGRRWPLLQEMLPVLAANFPAQLCKRSAPLQPEPLASVF